MNKFKILISKAIFAGMLVGIAGTVYLSVLPTNKLLGAVLFSFALLLVCAHALNLYTGKIGYFIDNKPSFIIDLLWMVIGNFIGAFIIAAIVRMSGLGDVIQTAQDTVASKMLNPWYEVIGLSILCGMLMYLAVEGYNRIKHELIRVLVVVFAVIIFIFSGYEHSIANMYYFNVAFAWDLKVFGYFLLMLLGNGIGAVMINLIEKIAQLKK